MTAMLETGTEKRPEPSAEQAAEELVRRWKAPSSG
jgi:hypothetical protein